MKKYKDVHQHQIQLLPPSLDELIEPGHLVRVIDQFVSSLSQDIWDKAFNGGGAPSFHPQMMLKVIIYAYACKLYSCRSIAKALRQDVTFMWLSGMQQPTFNTINRFRSQYLSRILPDVFTELLLFLNNKGYIAFKDYFVDGTKLAANAGRYTHVWKKNAQRYRTSVHDRVKRLFEEIDAINDAEDAHYGDSDLPERGEGSSLTPDEIRAQAKAVEERLKASEGKKKKRSIKSRIKKLKEEADKLERYDDQLNTLKGRNSYSKTDTDATFLRMKDDQLLPAYNVQASSENQFIVHYSISQNASDSASFPDHLTSLQERGASFLPNNYVGDAGYGSEENFELLENHGINNYLKYNVFLYDLKGENSKQPFHGSNFTYQEQEDVFICPTGESLYYQSTQENKTKTGYTCTKRIYEGRACGECLHKPECTSAQFNRTISYNPKLQAYRKQAYSNLTSEDGIALRKRRGFEIETFFGDLKHNQKFKRFQLRGLENVEKELGLLVLAYNLRKLAAVKTTFKNLFVSMHFYMKSKTFGLICPPIAGCR